MTPREVIADLLRREFGPHADRGAIDDFFRNLEAAGYVILPAAEVEKMRVEREAWFRAAKDALETGSITPFVDLKEGNDRAMKGERP